MNWKNVLILVNAYVKSYRLVRSERFRRFRERRISFYMLYIGACVLGALLGWFVGSMFFGTSNPQMKELVLQGILNLLSSLPTVTLLYGLVFTQIGQVQRLGVKAYTQPLYWLPMSWAEHTLASIISNILGLPLAVTLFISSGVIVSSVIIGVLPDAILTVLSLFIAIFMAAVTTEMTRVLQVRISGAVARRAGRAAVWLRLITSILFFILFYAVYFSLYYREGLEAIFRMVSYGQRALWFVPYLWPGITISLFMEGYILEAAVPFFSSIFFSYFLFMLAAWLNARYGLYEPPSIRISKGIHLSETGLLNRLGFKPVEAALIRKDFKAFIRRQELTYIFILPIISAIMPILSALNSGSGPHTAYDMYMLRIFISSYITLIPGAVMAMALGNVIMGIEDGSVWILYSSPINAKGLIKAKYTFTVLFSASVTFICFIIGMILWKPQLTIAVLSISEAILIILPLSMISLSFGVKGADFRDFPRRMIRPKWAIISIITCIAAAIAVSSPIIPYTITILLGPHIPKFWSYLNLQSTYLYPASILSAAISFTISFLFYRRAVGYAESLLLRAEEIYESLMFI